ncbi:MAG: acyltransferase [Flavobacteriales bacterium]|nr:acyltransferase [Flavobacteriales bacterium]
MTAAHPRIFGLDVMRATAILLVLFWHSLDLILDLAPTFPVPFYLDGVDVFFVLSGYLIGGILLKLWQRNDLSWRTRAILFWSRRFIRTLPNYYLFLLINVVLVARGWRSGMLNHNVLAYTVFLQNAWKPLDLFYWESWSLVIEEWFYVLFPALLLVFALALRSTGRRVFLVTACVFVVVPLVVRFQLLPDMSSLYDSEMFVRKLAITRLDTIVFGVLAAMAHARFPEVWQRFRWLSFVVGAIGVVLVPLAYGPQHFAYSSTWFYTLNAVAMALLLPLLASWRQGPSGGGVVTFISRISYSLYLVHLPLRSILERWYEPSPLSMAWVQLVVYWSLCMIVSWSVYRYFEKPVMDLHGTLLSRLGVRLTKSAS